MDPKNYEKNNYLPAGHVVPKLEELIASYKSLPNYEDISWKHILPEIIASLIASTFFLLSGMSMAYSAVLIAQLSQNNSEIQSTKSQNAMIASVALIGLPPGSLVSGILMDTIGRLNTMKLACIPGLIGWVSIIKAKSISAIICGRFIVGVSLALGLSPGVVYITEIANPKIRMSLLSISGPLTAFGMIVGYYGGWIVHWRHLSWIGIFLTLLSSMLCFLIPESPSWLITRGKKDEAYQSLKWMNKNQNKNEYFADQQLKLLQEEQKDNQSSTRSDKGVRGVLKQFLKPTAYKPIVILNGLFIFQHFSGLYITTFYLISFVENTKTSINANFISILTGIARLILTIVSIFTMKYFRRRSLFMISGFGMAFAMFIGGLYTRWIEFGSTTYKWVPAIAFLVYVMFTTIGYLTLPTTFIGEFLPLEIRGVAYSLTFCMYCAICFVTLQNYYSLNEYLGGGANLQWFFGAISLGGVMYCYIFIPETKGMKLIEITDHFKNNWIYIDRQ